MRIYFSGIGGSGICPLANLALDANFNVCGSDQVKSHNTDQLQSRGVNFNINQSGDFLESCHQQKPIDWLVYTSSLPKDHPELKMAKKLNIKATARDKFIPWFIKKHNFKLIAVAGTHGKTSTTTMLIWLFRQLNIPASYLVGSNLSFSNSGKFDTNSEYFIYEADEYDRNFLHYQPDYSLITSIDWDHIDIYPTKDNYEQAFADYINKSKQVFMWDKDYNKKYQHQNLAIVKNIDPKLELLGLHNKQNGQLVLELAKTLNLDLEKTIEIINNTPRASRRFEVLQTGLISDYAHHPVEIKATLQLAKEYQKKHNFNDIIVVYEPHQIDRQLQFKSQYLDSFKNADKIYWLPTYLARGSKQKPLTAKDLAKNLNQSVESEMNEELIDNIKNHLKSNNLVLLMTAGKLDFWIRQNL